MSLKKLHHLLNHRNDDNVQMAVELVASLASEPESFAAVVDLPSTVESAEQAMEFFGNSGSGHYLWVMYMLSLIRGGCSWPLALRTLKLRSPLLSHLLPHLHEFTQLQSLDLSDNKLREIPPSLLTLTE